MSKVKKNNNLSKFVQDQLNVLKAVRDSLELNKANMAGSSLGNLHEEIKRLESLDASYEDSVSLDLKGIRLPVSGIRRLDTRDNEIPKTFLKIQISCVVTKESCGKQDEAGQLYSKYNCHFVVENEEKNVCWHIDKASKEELDSQEFHPLYHLQLSCNKTNEQGVVNTGDFLLLDSPRFPYPPMDLALCIGFYFCNFREKSAFVDFLDSKQKFKIMYSKSYNSVCDNFWGDKAKTALLYPMSPNIPKVVTVVQ